MSWVLLYFIFKTRYNYPYMKNMNINMYKQINERTNEQKQKKKFKMNKTEIKKKTLYLQDVFNESNF